MATQLLDDAAITEALRDLPDWRLESADQSSLTLTAKLPSFTAAIEVVDRVAEVAERADHHPDIDIRYNTLSFRCSTHSEGGITAKDIDLANAISELIAARS
jgi:4a-hydroxytetrahydrobiopterin dehydratase